ncbi:hypothetical protein ARMGADRAFT_1032688 [Armillaria gallica]|uniref:Uncharacterized protein n=1 Tax=Armillaria gallica TaxID=47427 RepID=A0A2H3DPC5_ARMGA|nr:hypothetical protein ARMGADRAFT_1032688 [Armillaria gallica]
MPGYLYLLIDLRKVLDSENNINVKNSRRIFKRMAHSIPEPVLPPNSLNSQISGILRATRPFLDTDRDWILQNIELSVYDALLKRIDEIRSEIQSHRDAVHKSMAAYSSTLARIRRLPSENFRTVFREVQNTQWCNMGVHGSSAMSHIVLQYWPPHPTETLHHTVSALRAMIPRSAQYPLDIVFELQDDYKQFAAVQVFPMILEESYRWRSMVFKITLTLLEHMKVVREKIPCLESLTMKTAFIPYSIRKELPEDIRNNLMICSTNASDSVHDVISVMNEFIYRSRCSLTSLFIHNPVSFYQDFTEDCLLFMDSLVSLEIGLLEDENAMFDALASIGFLPNLQHPSLRIPSCMEPSLWNQLPVMITSRSQYLRSIRISCGNYDEVKRINEHLAPLRSPGLPIVVYWERHYGSITRFGKFECYTVGVKDRNPEGSYMYMTPTRRQHLFLLNLIKGTNTGLRVTVQKVPVREKGRLEHDDKDEPGKCWVSIQNARRYAKSGVANEEDEEGLKIGDKCEEGKDETATALSGVPSSFKLTLQLDVSTCNNSHSALLGQRSSTNSKTSQRIQSRRRALAGNIDENIATPELDVEDCEQSLDEWTGLAHLHNGLETAHFDPTPTDSSSTNEGGSIPTSGVGGREGTHEDESLMSATERPALLCDFTSTFGG